MKLGEGVDLYQASIARRLHHLVRVSERPLSLTDARQMVREGYQPIRGGPQQPAREGYQPIRGGPQQPARESGIGFDNPKGILNLEQ